MCSCCETDATAEKHPRQRKKVWTCEEKAAVNEHLGVFLRTRRIPGKQKITEAMKASGNLFKDRTWRNIKDFVRNQIRKKDALDFLHN